VLIVANDHPGTDWSLPQVVVECETYARVLREAGAAFRVLRNLTAARFRAALDAHRPTVVIFCGHGDLVHQNAHALGFISERGGDGRVFDLVDHATMAGYLLAQPLRLLLLNACETHGLAQEVVKMRLQQRRARGGCGGAAAAGASQAAAASSVAAAEPTLEHVICWRTETEDEAAHAFGGALVRRCFVGGEGAAEAFEGAKAEVTDLRVTGCMLDSGHAADVQRFVIEDPATWQLDMEAAINSSTWTRPAGVPVLASLQAAAGAQAAARALEAAARGAQLHAAKAARLALRAAQATPCVVAHEGELALARLCAEAAALVTRRGTGAQRLVNHSAEAEAFIDINQRLRELAAGGAVETGAWKAEDKADADADAAEVLRRLVGLMQDDFARLGADLGVQEAQHKKTGACTASDQCLSEISKGGAHGFTGSTGSTGSSGSDPGAGQADADRAGNEAAKCSAAAAAVAATAAAMAAAAAVAKAQARAEHALGGGGGAAANTAAIPVTPTATPTAMHTVDANLINLTPSGGISSRGLVSFGGAATAAAAAAPAEKEDDASCELVRVVAGCGWAVHALVFEFSDGKRYGTIQSNGCTAMPLTDASIAERCGTTIDIAPGDAIVRAEGHGLRDCPDYLCWGVSLLMSSGARHDVCSTHEDWKGAPFEFDIAPRVLVELLFEHHAVSARTVRRLRRGWGAAVAATAAPAATATAAVAKAELESAEVVAEVVAAAGAAVAVGAVAAAAAAAVAAEAEEEEEALAAAAAAKQEARDAELARELQRAFAQAPPVPAQVAASAPVRAAAGGDALAFVETGGKAGEMEAYNHGKACRKTGDDGFSFAATRSLTAERRVDLLVAEGSNVKWLFVGMAAADKDLSLDAEGEFIYGSDFGGDDAWLMECGSGRVLYSLHGVCDWSPAAAPVEPGSVMSIEHNKEARTVRFLVNGEPHGPGFDGVSSSSLKLCVCMGSVGNEVQLLDCE
jgi:hypothetical protein